MACVCSGLLDEYPEDTTVMFGAHWHALEVLYWYALYQEIDAVHLRISSIPNLNLTRFPQLEVCLENNYYHASLYWLESPNSGCVWDKTWSWISRALKDWINLWSLTCTITRLNTCVAWIRSPLCSKFLLQWVYQRVLTCACDKVSGSFLQQDQAHQEHWSTHQLEWPFLREQSYIKDWKPGYIGAIG